MVGEIGQSGDGLADTPLQDVIEVDFGREVAADPAGLSADTIDEEGFQDLLRAAIACDSKATREGTKITTPYRARHESARHIFYSLEVDVKADDQLLIRGYEAINDLQNLQVLGNSEMIREFRVKKAFASQIDEKLEGETIYIVTFAQDGPSIILPRQELEEISPGGEDWDSSALTLLTLLKRLGPTYEETIRSIEDLPKAESSSNEPYIAKKRGIVTRAFGRTAMRLARR